MPQSVPDAELVRRFKEGDRSAYAEIVRRYQDRVFTLCLRWMGDRGVAEDVSQDVFLALFRSLANFRGDSQLSTWVFRVVINHCKNRRQYQRRRAMDLHEPLEGNRPDPDSRPRQIADEGPGTDARLHATEAQSVLDKALLDLEEEHRAVIVLRDVQDLSYEEIADVLGLPRGTVKSRIAPGAGTTRRRARAHPRGRGSVLAMTRPTASEQLSAWIDGELSEAEAAELEAELARDPSLRAELEELEAVVQLLHRDGPVSAPDGFEARVLARTERERIPGLRLAWVRRPLGVPIEVWGLGLAVAAALVVTVLPTLRGGQPEEPPEPAALDVRPFPKTESAVPPPGSSAAPGDDKDHTQLLNRGRTSGNVGGGTADEGPTQAEDVVPIEPPAPPHPPESRAVDVPGDRAVGHRVGRPGGETRSRRAPRQAGDRHRLVRAERSSRQPDSRATRT